MKTRIKCLSVIGAVVLASGCASLSSSGESDAGDKPNPIVRSPQESDAQYKLGKYYMGQGRMGLALAAFNRSMAHDPSNWEARNGRAVALTRIGDFKAAIVELETAVASNPNSAYLLNNLAYVHMLNGSLILAAESLQKALILEPDNAKARENWQELSRRATSNPELARQMMNSIPPATEPPMVPTEQIKAEPRGDARVRSQSMAVLNIDFGTGVTYAQPLVASVAEPPAVDLRTISEASTQPNTLAVVLSPSVTPFPLVASVAEIPVQPELLSAVVGDTPIISTTGPADGNRRPVRPVDLALLPPRYDLNGVRIEVSNGNGVIDMARVLREELKRQNIPVRRISNAESFEHAVTRIHYTGDHRNEALALSKMLPVEAEVVPESTLTSSVINLRIVIGRDITSHEMAREVAPAPVARSDT